jgi:hypothetical protein
VIDWWWWLGRRRRRRAAAAEQLRYGRGCSDFGEDRGGADQCAARVAPMWPSGGARMVGWLRDQVEGGAHRAAARRRPLALVLWGNTQVYRLYWCGEKS